MLQDIAELFVSYKSKFENLYNSNKYVRIITITTGSFTAAWMMRIIYLKLWRKYKKLPNGPYGIPLIGSSMNVLDYKWYEEMNKTYGSVYTFQLGMSPCVVINNPFLAQKLFNDSRLLDIPPIFGETDIQFDQMNGTEWAKRRKLVVTNMVSTLNNVKFIENAIKSFISKKLFPVFNDNINKNEEIDFKKCFRAVGFNSVLHACFGLELSGLDDPFLTQFFKELNEGFKTIAIAFIIQSIFNGTNIISDFIFKLFGIKGFIEAFTNLQKLIEEFATDDKNKLDILREEDDDKNNNLKLFNNYVNDYVENKENNLTKQKLYGDMSSMFTMATDTTYGAFAWCLIIAAKHQSLQQELYHELTDAFGKDINNIRLSQGGILKIPKLRAFIYEILRIYPPSVIAFVREIKFKDFKIDTRELEENGRIYNLDKGTNIMVSVVACHLNPAFWIKNYDPINNEKHKNINMKDINLEFWLDEDGKFDKSRNGNKLYTFGRGKRDCVGKSLVIKQLNIVLAMIFMTYKVYGPNGEKENDFDVEIISKLGEVITPSPNTMTLKLR